MVLKLFVFSHVAAGMVSLLTAPVAMAVSKGGSVPGCRENFFLEYGVDFYFCDRVRCSAH